MSDSHDHHLEQLTADQVSRSFSHLCSAILHPRIAEIGVTWQAWGAKDMLLNTLHLQKPLCSLPVLPLRLTVLRV